MVAQVKKVKKTTHIGLKVKNQDENVLFFRFKKGSPLRKLMDAYCVHQNVEYGTLKFIYDGSCLKSDQTPEELNMEEGDEIDILNDQISA